MRVASPTSRFVRISRTTAIAPLLLACTLMSAFSTAPAFADDKAPAAKAALTVTTEKPQTTNLSLKIAADGNVLPWQEAVVASEANGLRLVEVKVNVGDVVSKGQVLAVFSTDTLNAEMAQIKASLAEAQANLADAEGNAARARALAVDGAMSKQQVSQLLTLAQTSKAKVEVQQAALKAQQFKIAQAQVLAADSGVISSRSATVGSVMVNGQELFRLIRQSRLEWRAELPASDLVRINVGNEATLFAANGTAIKGKVRMVAPSVDQKTRAGLVYIDLPNNPNLKAGMFAKGEIDLGASNGMTVSQQALVVRDGYSYVFLLAPDKSGGNARVAQTKIQTGRRFGERIEVLQGLKPDALVVASGAGFLHDGDIVKVAGAAESKAAAPQLGATTSKAAK